MRRMIRAWVPLVTLVASAVVPGAVRPASEEEPPDPSRRPGSSPRG